MPPVPPFRLVHRLSAWLDCTLEVRCGCGRSSYPPIPMLIRDHGDLTFADLARKLRCTTCHGRPAEVYLVAGFHRRCHGGPESNDWAVALV